MFVRLQVTFHTVLAEHKDSDIHAISQSITKTGSIY